MSTFFSMINYIFEKSFLNKMSPNESYALFRKIISKHCLESPPFSIGIILI